jgi:tetratricopeptide (TPR) repeat protein
MAKNNAKMEKEEEMKKKTLMENAIKSGKNNIVEIDTAISCFTEAIKLYEKDVYADFREKIAEAYQLRGYLNCFLNTKEHKEKNYKDVIENCSNAIRLSDKEKEKEKEKEKGKGRGKDKDNEILNSAYKIRAYAYYLSGDYMSAINDCKKIIPKEYDPELNPKNETERDAYELLSDVYSAMNCNDTAADNYKKALIRSDMRPSLIKKYSDACRKIKGE